MKRHLRARPEASPSRRNAKAGYSLLEILIVLSIIALIAALVGPRLFAQLDKSKVTTARVQAQALKAALDTMRLDIGRYPSPEEGLGLLVASSQQVVGWTGPYLEGGVPDDPWRRPYAYTAPASPEGAPVVASLGADGRPGGEGLNADVMGQQAIAPAGQAAATPVPPTATPVPPAPIADTNPF